ncbi:hypothetical protein MTBSS4_90136 [Magnetospirillum sp. SS-4]|nr:hypothetical protein MTBSS4_90136 [Magnetospirillum sp. SS-4]
MLGVLGCPCSESIPLRCGRRRDHLHTDGACFHHLNCNDDPDDPVLRQRMPRSQKVGKRFSGFVMLDRNVWPNCGGNLLVTQFDRHSLHETMTASSTRARRVRLEVPDRSQRSVGTDDLPPRYSRQLGDAVYRWKSGPSPEIAMTLEREEYCRRIWANFCGIPTEDVLAQHVDPKGVCCKRWCGDHLPPPGRVGFLGRPRRPVGAVKGRDLIAEITSSRS